MSSPDGDETEPWVEEIPDADEEQPFYTQMTPDSGGFGACALYASLYQGEDHGLVQNLRLAQLFLTLEHGLNKMALDVGILKTAMGSVDPRSVPQAERDRLLEIYDRLSGLLCVQRIFYENKWIGPSSVLSPMSGELRAFAQQLTNPLASDPAFFQ